MSTSNSERIFTTGGLHFARSGNLMELDVAKRCTEVLGKHYPGYMWGVNVDIETGMVAVRNFSLSGEWGFNLHLKKVQEDVEGKLLKLAGGEILERYRAKRGKVDTDSLLALPTDRLGRIVADRSGAKQEWQ